MTEQTITVAERNFINHSSMFGLPSVVRKVHRGWMVGHGPVQHPMVFKTKRAAMDAAQTWICAISRRPYTR